MLRNPGSCAAAVIYESPLCMPDAFSRAPLIPLMCLDMGTVTSSLNVSKIYALPYGTWCPIECESGVDPDSQREFTPGTTHTCSRIAVFKSRKEAVKAENDLAARRGYPPQTTFLDDTSLLCRLLTRRRVPSYHKHSTL